MPLLSIIVPVYRAERFLHKCIDSILNQSLSDLELILVDDGSPDGSGEICDVYVQKDARVKVIHQKNSGVSAARNRGLEEATGEFVGFVDSDDWVTESMYETMYTAAITQDAEIVMCDIRAVCEDGTEQMDTIRQLAGDCLLIHEDRTPELMPDFGGSACRCIYQRALLEEYHIQFPEGLKFSEDRIFNIYSMGRAKRVAYLKKPLYVQYVNMDSCVHRYHSDYFTHVKRAVEKTEGAVAAAWDNNLEYQRAYHRHFFYGALGAIYNVKHAQSGLSWKQKMKEIKHICDDSKLRAVISDLKDEDCRRMLILNGQHLLLYFSDSRWYQKIENFLEVYKNNGMIGVMKKCVEKLVE